MIPLNAVDLDGTLLRADSFRVLVRRHLDVRLAALVGARLLGGIDRAGFAAAASRHLAPILADEAVMQRFAVEMETHVDPDVLAMARARGGGGAVTVVLSASPEEYVIPLAQRLGFEGVGSRWREGRYLHCYGERKRAVLRERFPPERYRYELAIADSRSDEPLLALFSEAVRHRRS
jgi:phosphoserine phosphatase